MTRASAYATSYKDGAGDWRNSAACLGHPDPELWYADPGQHERRAWAITICDTCPAIAACARDAYRTETQPGAQVWGIRAGLTPEQRIRIRRKRRAREAT